MPFKVNDYVWVIDEEVSGVIKRMDSHTIYVETEDGFLLAYQPEELLLQDHKTHINTQLFKNADIKSIISQKESPKQKPSVKIKSKKRFEPTMEVDLHINQLVKSTKGMTNHDMLTLQLETAKRKLEFALSKHIKKVVFIHGVGAGVLKLELTYLFKRYDRVTYYDADYKTYGLGATEVYIHNTAK